MNKNSKLFAILCVGLACFAIGVYMVVFQGKSRVSESQNYLTKTETKETVSPNLTTPNCTVKYTSGSCWTITPRRKPENVRLPSDVDFLKPKVTISNDGISCKVIVPANSYYAVKTETDSQKFILSKGDVFEIKAEGTVAFSTDHDRVDANGYSGWYDPYVDSPFKQNVGGLEFSIGGLDSNRFFAGKYFRGTAEFDGVPIFRVIDRATSVDDAKFGGFIVTIRKIK